MNWKKTMATLFMAGLTAVSFADNNENNNPINDKDMENLNLTAEWDKTFLKSDKVNHSKVTFTNRYGITLAADMYVPKNTDGKLPAIAVCGPFGAVKEQAAGLYAQTMAERGFLTIAFRAIPLAGGYQNVVDTFTAAGKPGAMTFYGLGSYGVMAAIALVLSTAMGVIGTPTHRTRIYTSKDEKTARKAFLGQGILLFGWSFVTAIIGMSCFTIATMNGDTLASGDYAFAYMATNALPPIIGMMFMICGLSATMSSGDSDAISGVTILLTDVYPSVTGKTIKEEDYAKYSRIALICTLGAAFFITLFVNDVIGYISTIVGAFLPGVAVAMLLGRFWKRVNWQGGLACIGSGTLLGVLILVLPSFKNWINATMGGPAVPATIISLVFGIVVSLMFPADTTPDDVRLKHVMDDRRGTVVEKVAAAEAAAEEEEDL